MELRLNDNVHFYIYSACSKVTDAAENQSPRRRKRGLSLSRWKGWLWIKRIAIITSLSEASGEGERSSRQKENWERRRDTCFAVCSRSLWSLKLLICISFRFPDCVVELSRTVGVGEAGQGGDQTSLWSFQKLQRCPVWGCFSHPDLFEMSNCQGWKVKKEKKSRLTSIQYFT